MTDSTDALRLDWSDLYLAGPPLRLSLTLPVETWAKLTERTADRYPDGVFEAMPIASRIECFLDELLYEAMLCKEPLVEGYDAEDDIPF